MHTSQCASRATGAGVLLLLVLFSLINPARSTYALTDNYNTSNFFNDFDFYNGPDPTHGSVIYRDGPEAIQLGLINIKETVTPTGKTDTVLFRAYPDALNATFGQSRPSVRLSSKKRFTRGLFIADIVHMPAVGCSVWPSFWTGDVADWPKGGEIDIIEGVNLQSANHVYLHTAGKCNMTGPASMSGGQPGGVDCSEGSGVTGCGFVDLDPTSWSSGFNAQGGGVYAMEWTSQHIGVWWWRRSEVPPDVLHDQPNPQSWKKPVAYFQGDCNIDGQFNNHQIIFDVTFCGDWAATPVIWDQGCSAQAGPSCLDYMTHSTFPDAYWELNSMKVFQGS